MVKALPTITIENFNGGLNFRDDEFKLQANETPFAQNFEINTNSGLKKAGGFLELFDPLPEDLDFYEVFPYTNTRNEHSYIGVAYPQIFQIDPANGNYQSITDTYLNTGDPFGFDAEEGKMVVVDGANAPRIIQDGVVTTVTWPPVYTDANNADGNLDETMLATASNPVADDIGLPSFGVFHTNRNFLAGDPEAPRRLYASKVGDIGNFSDNDPLNFNIAFFVDVPSSSPITALQVISDRDLVIFCEREVLLMTGENPPGTAYQDQYKIRTLTSSVGCLGKRLVARKGDNDLYFVADNGKVYQLSLTRSFQEVKPLGLTEKIFPFLETRNNEAFARGRLINYFSRGELHFWLPSVNQRAFPDQTLILNYADQPSEPVWSLTQGYGDNFSFRSALLDRETNKLIVCNQNQFFEYNSDEATSYNGSPIKSVHQVATIDFNTATRIKEIPQMIFNCTSRTGANVTLLHLWDTGQSGFTNIVIPAQPDSRYGTAIYDESIYVSNAGTSFTRVPIEIPNALGSILKMRIVHESATETFTINSINLEQKLMGQP